MIFLLYLLKVRLCISFLVVVRFVFLMFFEVKDFNKILVIFRVVFNELVFIFVNLKMVSEIRSNSMVVLNGILWWCMVKFWFVNGSCKLDGVFCNDFFCVVCFYWFKE